MVFAAATTLVPQASCSFLFLDRPSAYKSGEKKTCTTTYQLPTVDLVFALLHAVSISILASASGDAFGGEKTRSQLAGADLTWLILHAGSSGFGYYWVGECKELVGDSGFGTRPVQPSPRPRPRPSAPPADASSAQPAPPPIQPEPAQPDAGSPAPTPQAPRVPQRIDSE